MYPPTALLYYASCAASLVQGLTSPASGPQPRTLLPNTGLDLGLSAQDSQNASKVASALIGHPPAISLGQLLQDLTPRVNLSTSLDEACNAIHSALPNTQSSGRVCSSLDCLSSYGLYYNNRQAANHPACVIYPASTDEVSTIVKTIRQYDAHYAVRSVAGHSTGFNFTSQDGFSSTTGILIDMRKFTSVTYDTETGVARWETGINFGTLATEMAKYDAQVAGSRLAHIGAGCTLGGGLTWFTSQAGLGSDTNVALEMVLADGEVVTATNDNEYSDLFWAMKAGMNQFGIVTAIHSRTFPGSGFFGGTILYADEQLPKLFEALAEWYGGRADKYPKGNILVVITNLVVDTAVTRLNQIQIFYDGQDPGDCFASFFAIPHIFDDTKVQPYADFITNSLTNIPIAFQGFNTALLSAVTDIPTVADLHQIYDTWNDYATSTDGIYLQNSLSFTVMTNTTLAAHKAAGGSPMGVEDAGAYLWIVYDLSSLPAIGALEDPTLFGGAVTASQKIPQSSRHLPLYANYARVEQKPYLSYNPDTLARFRQIKAKYDPDSFITTHTNGHVFY